MSVLPSTTSSSLLDWIDDVPPNIQSELKNRYDELSQLEQAQVQMGTAVPQLYGSLSRFIANPSTVSVETYKRMLDTDETIGSGIDFLNLCLIARFGDYTHPVPKIQHFVRRALQQMKGSWHENLDEMFSAEWAGFSLTEQVWTFKHDFDGAPAFVPEKIVTYPPLTLVFAVNRHGEVLPDGVYQYQRYHNTFFNSHIFGNRPGDLDGFRPDLFASVGDFPYPIRIAADLTYLTVKIPTSKLIHLRSSSTGKFNNPYGRSIFRRIYKNWVMKDAFLKMWCVAADRKGTPLLVGYAAPNDTVLEQTGSGGQNGQQPERADVAMARTFKTIHNSSFVVLPGKKGEVYDVEAIEVTGDMNVFKDGIDYFNRAIMRGLLIPALIMGGDGGGSYSLGQEHHKIFEKIVDGKLKVYKQNILDQFIQKIIAYNFPKALWEKYGHGEFALEEYDPDVMEKLANIFASLTEHGYMTAEAQDDMDFVRQKMGMKKAVVSPIDPATGLPGAVAVDHEDTNTSESADPNGAPAAADPADPATEEDDGAKPNPEGTEAEDPAPVGGPPKNVSPAANDAANTDPADSVDSAEVLNGAQVTSLVDVVKSVADGSLPRDSAIQIIMTAFKLSNASAVKLLGKAGTGAKPRQKKGGEDERLPSDYKV